MVGGVGGGFGTGAGAGPPWSARIRPAAAQGGALVSAIGHWNRPGPRYTLRLPATGSPPSFPPHPFMPPPPPAQARTRFDLKSASLPVLAVVLKTTDAALLATELAGCVADAPGFFDNDTVLIDLD